MASEHKHHLQPRGRTPNMTNKPGELGVYGVVQIVDDLQDVVDSNIDLLQVF